MKTNHIHFPAFSGIRCLMMPYVQGDHQSVPEHIRRGYADILASVFDQMGKIGYLTIDESVAVAGNPHRGARAKHGRALHTEAGRLRGENVWGSTWGGQPNVFLDRGVRVLLANSLDDSCAIWDAEHEDTTEDGDIGHLAAQYPYDAAELMKAGDVHSIGIFTPHESIPVKSTTNRQFLRIVGAGVHGREPYFTENPLMSV